MGKNNKGKGKDNDGTKGGCNGRGKGSKGGGKGASVKADADDNWRGGGASVTASRDVDTDRRYENHDTKEPAALKLHNGHNGYASGDRKIPSEDVPKDSSTSIRPAAVQNGGGAFPSQDVRYTHSSQDVRYESKEARVSLPCQDIRYETQDARFDESVQREPKAKARSRGGKNRRSGAGDGGKENKAEKSDKGGQNGKGGNSGRRKAGGKSAASDTEAGDDSDHPDGDPVQSVQLGNEDPSVEEPELEPAANANANKALSSKIRKLLQSYETSLETEDLGQAFNALKDSVAAGNGFCDAQTLQLLLVNLTKVNKLANAHEVIDAAVSEKVYLDPSAIIAIATSVSQRSQSHKALRYLRRLIYECLPEDFGEEQTIFFDKHLSFIFSELMAEADGCFGRMDNKDPTVLVNLGHAELDIQMDWEKSSGTNFVLFNRSDESGSKKVYQPTVFGQGFQKTDSALMSFDISHPQVRETVAATYDRIHDGAEVEIVSSATSPDKHAALGVRLTSPPKVPFRPGMLYRLDRLASRDQTRRMLDAIKVILRKPIEKVPAKGTPAASIKSLQPSSMLRELVLVPAKVTLTKARKAHLPMQEMDHNSERRAALAQFQEDAKHAYSHLLNKSQLEALTTATSLRLTLIQGPPGTGKTTTAVQIVSALVEYGLVDLPMLVTADSNTAVDNLVKGIGKRGLSVVRVGRPDSIREDVKQYSLDGRWKDLKKAEVVCATCIGASGSTLDKVRFSTVLVDECTQAAESAALVPMARGCQQAILIGDQCQLPPTVLSDVAENEQLGESLFTRLVTQGVRPVLLDTQYRMHPLIAEFASAAFYNGRLQNGVSHIHRKPPEGFPWPQRQMPVAFLNLEKGEEKREGSSYINNVEAEKTLWALLEVCKNGQLGPEDVGVVTPYKGQVNFIKKLIKERPGLQNFRKGLEVESVDGFQGQEKEVIIFCAVRNNREGKVGFLSDWRRLNVMLTRARRGVIVIGSKSTLISDPLWREWLVWATARGAICGESAKGTWQPKYLVDDRDGVWTIKAQVIGEDKGTSGTSGAAAASAAAALQEPEEVLDSWEDLGSPLVSPVHTSTAKSPPSPLKLDESEEPEETKPCSPVAPSPPPEVPAVSRAQEQRAERLRIEAEAAEQMAQLQIASSLGGLDSAAGGDRPSAVPGSPELRGKRRPAGLGADANADAMRTSSTPTLGPRSPQRQLAMAKLGLLEDAEAEELGKGPGR